MRVNGQLYSAHRVSWEIHNGPIRTALQVLHHCDNPSCVRPGHLWLGTNLDNIADKTKKGRAHGARGEKIPWSILTEKKVKKIRSWHSSGKYNQAEIACILKVKSPTIGAVIRRKTWKHI